MDIVTNVIGVLFFVLVYASLVAIQSRNAPAEPEVTKVEAHVAVNTPVLSKGETEPVILVCANNKVLYPRIELLLDRAKAIINQILPDKTLRTESELSSIRSAIEQANIRNRDFELHFIGMSLRLNFIDQSRGDTAATLQDGQSEFGQALAEFNSNRQHIFFIVDNDSFEVFHAARKAAVDTGFKAGWEPKEQGKPIMINFFGGAGVVDVDSHF